MGDQTEGMVRIFRHRWEIEKLGVDRTCETRACPPVDASTVPSDFLDAALIQASRLPSQGSAPKLSRVTNNPLLVNAPAIVRARVFGADQDIEGASCLDETGRAPNRPMALMTAFVCVAFTSVRGYVFISPDMPGLDPTIDYARSVPTGNRFLTIWMVLTLCLAGSFYLVFAVFTR